MSGGKAQPHWLSDKKQRSLKKDEAYRYCAPGSLERWLSAVASHTNEQHLNRRRIELVQDLNFPEACQRLKLSADGQFLVATGIHPPRVRYPVFIVHSKLLGRERLPALKKLCPCSAGASI